VTLADRQQDISGCGFLGWRGGGGRGVAGDDAAMTDGLGFGGEGRGESEGGPTA
jgi:hypothetical protein